MSEAQVHPLVGDATALLAVAEDAARRAGELLLEARREATEISYSPQILETFNLGQGGVS